MRQASALLDQLGCSKQRSTRDASVQDDASYCVPQSDSSGIDGQAWTKDGHKSHSKTQRFAIFFPVLKLMLTCRECQVQATSKANLAYLQLREEYSLIPEASHAPPRKAALMAFQPRLVSSVSLSTISRTFHSLFRVLFIFPSRYLFAIGLSPIFSFR